VNPLFQILFATAFVDKSVTIATGAVARGSSFLLPEQSSGFVEMQMAKQHDNN